MHKRNSSTDPATKIIDAVEAGLRDNPTLLAFFRKNRRKYLSFAESYTREGLIYVYAFGSNLQKKQMAERTPGSHPLARARLPDYALAFAGHSRNWGGPVATIISSRGSEVQGAVYALTRGQLHLLDRWEGYPNTYGRKWVTVIGDDGKKYRALAYYHNKPATSTPPSVAYERAVNGGRAEWGYGPF